MTHVIAADKIAEGPSGALAIARADPPEIYLEPPPGDPGTGRCWCVRDQGTEDDPWTRYVRADLVRRWLNEAHAEVVELRKLLESRRMGE